MELTVRKKLIIGFSILIILICLLGGFGTYYLSRMNNDVNILYDMHLKGIEHIKDAQVNLISLGDDRGMLLLSSDAMGKESSILNMRSTFEKFEKNLQDFMDTTVLEEEREIVTQILELWEELRPNEEMIIEMSRRTTNDEAYQQATQNRLIAERIEFRINTLVTQKNELAEKANNESELLYKSALGLSITIIIVSVLVGIIVSIYISNIIAKPIAKMAVATKRIAEGDLSVESIEVKNKDEIGELANSFNAMVEGLGGVIRNVLDASQQVAASSQQISASSEETTAASQEIATTINELAIGASKQAEDASHTSVLIHQMATSIQSVANNANSVSSLSINVSEEANVGLGEARKAVGKIQRIKLVTEESAQNVKLLGEQSREIGQIVEVIKGISDQTNLLSLNAAIEAARAGEQGRGFAVVADEVRKLAVESAASALQISELINNIQNETKQVVSTMDNTMQEVLEGVDAVNSTGSSFELIVSEINNITSEIQQISASVQQIAGGSQSVDQSIESIAAIAEQTAASSEEVSAASEEQTATMEEVANASQDLARLAEELQMNVSKFRL
ncbi:MAG: methyl-accepting chemotaxis protein [Tissierellales bacterium]